MPKYIDIHAHVNFKAFKEDTDEVIRRALENNTWLINVGSQYGTSKRAVEMAHQYNEGVFAIVGLHPIHLEEGFHDDEEIGGEGFMTHGEVFEKEKYLELLKDSKVVGIGECGLDYYHGSKEVFEKQKKIFREHVALAEESGKALMIHARNSFENKELNVYQDIIEIIKEFKNVKGVSHCFGGSVEDMRGFVALGFYVSFSGNITYKWRSGFPNYEEIIKEVPLDKILTDTDSPYLAPVPYRGKRNEPLYVKEIVKKIAEIKGLPESEVAEAIVVNAKKLFDI